MSVESGTNIIITDYAVGDDRLAGAYGVSQAEEHNDLVLFVAGYGNRPTAKSFENLQIDIPAIVRHLPPMWHDPKIVYGEDASLTTRERYEAPDGDIVYLIHADLGGEAKQKSSGIDLISSESAYEELIKKTDEQINVLSLAATTELPLVIEKLQKQISELIVMGGVLTIQGNTGPSREANFTHDPVATEKALQLAKQYDIPFILVPLDTTEQESVLFNEDRLKFLVSGLGDSFGMQVVNSVVGRGSVYGEFYRGRTYQNFLPPYDFKNYSGVPVHDLTAAIVQTDIRFNLGIFAYETVSLQPNLLGEIGLARPYMEPNYSVIVATELLKYDEFWRLTAERFASYRSEY